jgi:biopolymer transport protein ExbB
MPRSRTFTILTLLSLTLILGLAPAAVLRAQEDQPGSGGPPAAAAAQEQAAAGPAAAQPPGSAETGEDLDLFSLLMKGGWVMIPILLASVLALTLTIERFISLRKSKIIPPQFLQEVKSLFEREDKAAEAGGLAARAGVEYCRNNPCVLGSLIQAGLPKVGKDEKTVQDALEDAGAREVDRMKRSLKPLSMIATVAPLLGLLGTVYGMIGAFRAATGAGVGKSDVLAQGIYEALVTTAAGLTLAIPVLIVYMILNNRVDAITDELDSSAEQFMGFAAATES